MEMILNGEMLRKSESQNDWNRTMFLCSNFADFWVWSVVRRFFSSPTLLPSCHLACIVLG